MRPMSSSEMRRPYSGSVPVAGLPSFLLLAYVDFSMITYNVKAGCGEARTSAPTRRALGFRKLGDVGTGIFERKEPDVFSRIPCRVMSQKFPFVFKAS